LPDAGAGGSVTVTVVVAEAVPPGPEQVKTNWVVAVSAAVEVDREVGSQPVQPPETVQPVAFALLRASY
jgi:hypothetical protein